MQACFGIAERRLFYAKIIEKNKRDAVFILFYEMVRMARDKLS